MSWWLVTVQQQRRKCTVFFFQLKETWPHMPKVITIFRWVMDRVSLNIHKYWRKIKIIGDGWMMNEIMRQGGKLLWSLFSPFIKSRKILGDFILFFLKISFKKRQWAKLKMHFGKISGIERLFQYAITQPINRAMLYFFVLSFQIWLNLLWVESQASQLSTFSKFLACCSWTVMIYMWSRLGGCYLLTWL